MRSSEGNAFGDLLGQLRVAANISQQELANLMERSRGTIANWEQGTYLPKARGLVVELGNHLCPNDPLKRDQLLTAALFDPVGAIWNIPFQRNPFFTGRKDILDYLHKALSTDKTIAVMQPQALKGLGGIGKTHTVIEYAYRYRDEYQAILWAPAATASILQTSLVSIAAILNLPEKTVREQDPVVEAVKRWFMNHSGWLLILDNVEDLESVQSLYPWAHSGHVIITTRSQSVGGIVAASISLEKMESEEGALFLLSRATLIGPDEGIKQAKGIDYEKARALSMILDGLPLALDQAAAYIEKTKCGLSTYITLYNTRRTKLLNERGSLTADHPESVTITFSLAFQNVNSTSLAAGELLLFCAFLSSDAIPEEIITNGGAYLGSILEALATDLEEFNAAIGLLLAYSLVQRDTDIETRTQVLSVHRLVQAVLQDMLKKEEQNLWAERSMSAVSAIFPTDDRGNWPLCERLLPHALICTTWIEQVPLVSPSAVHLLNRTGAYLYERARYGEAEPLYRRALAMYELALGVTHYGITSSLNNLATLYLMQGRYKEAEPLYQRALDIDTQIYGSEHLEVAINLHNLATLYINQGRYAEAELLLSRAFTIYEQQLGSDHPETLGSLNNLAGLYFMQGKYSEAEPLLRQVLSIREQQLGLDHPDTAESLNNLAELYRTQGKYVEAEPLYQRALKIAEQQKGDTHHFTATILNNLATLHVDQERYAEAESLYQHALEIVEQQLGADHPDTARGLSNLATLYVDQERYAEAEPLLKRALEILEQQLGADHPDIATSLSNLADLYQTQGKDTKAEPLLRRALSIREQQFGGNHPDTVKILNNLATLYYTQGKYRDAEPLYERVLTIRKVQLGVEHPDTVSSLNSLALLFRLLGITAANQEKWLESNRYFARALVLQP